MTSSEGRSSVLNLLNFFWGAGAVSCPFLLAALQRGEQIGLFIAALLGLLGLLVLALLFVPIRESESASPSTSAGFSNCDISEAHTSWSSGRCSFLCR